jgi:ribosomal-protein-alanine N-acetyltransferase
MSAQLRPAPERFEPMSRGDLDAVLAVEDEIYPFPWTRGNFEDSLHAGYSAWILRDADATLIAYAVMMLAVDEAHLLNLSVARRYHRHGYGWTMLEWMAARARDHGARTMLLEVRPSNAPARRLYERYGFERIGVRRGYYPSHGGREDALVLRIAL